MSALRSLGQRGHSGSFQLRVMAIPHARGPGYGRASPGARGLSGGGNATTTVSSQWLLRAALMCLLPRLLLFPEPSVLLGRPVSKASFPLSYRDARSFC